MTATTLKAIDQALATRYAGLTILTGNPQVSTPVTVFLEEPLSEEARERKYPSISINMMAMRFDSARAHTDDEAGEQIAIDLGVDPAVRTESQRGIPYRIVYSIDTWHRALAGEDRDLVLEALIRRTPPRGYVTAVNIRGGNEALWALWGGDVVVADEREVDVMTYHKSLTLEVLATLQTEATPTDHLVAENLQWSVQSRRTRVLADGTQVPVAGSEEGDIRIQIDQDGAVTVLPDP